MASRAAKKDTPAPAAGHNVQSDRRVSPGTLIAWLARHTGWTGSDCLIFPYGRNSAGYGQIKVEGRKGYAHRWMCEAVHGSPDAERVHVAHSCGNGHLGCVNPRHLRWATPAENMADRVGHGTANRGERQGHAKLTESDVREIIALYRQGRPLGEIAKTFNIAKSNVCLIGKGRTWAWLQPERAAA